ncbi:MAG: response regulator transcription factor [Bacteroidales bacterium]|nr:response regulator transcription factor [Bacteroidales bacterium]
MKNAKYRILLVDDESDILDFISYNLTKEGYLVDTATNGTDALQKMAELKPHLVLLDVMMPGIDGFEVCKAIRMQKQYNDVLIAFLSARSEDYSQIEGFESGADDYIAKPIRPKVLVSKVQSLLRRSSFVKRSLRNSSFYSQGSIHLKNLVIDVENYTVSHEGDTFVLPRKEFELLYLLASKPSKVFRREEIYAAVWGDEVVVGDRTIDVHVRRLREKLGIDNIITIKGVGYKYEE